jgi:hypothetical protein
MLEIENSVDSWMIVELRRKGHEKYKAKDNFELELGEFEKKIQDEINS